jgi:Nuclease-related domain.
MSIRLGMDIDPGTAGASARRTHERRRDAREARVKGKLGNRIGGLVLAVTDEPQSIRAWEIGARGEEKVAKALAGLAGVRILHDRGAPGTKANIDHLVIAPAGIFVVDAKNLRGQIHIRNKGWFLRPDYRLYVGSHDGSNLAADLGWQVEAVRAALNRAGVEPMPTITPVLCFVDGDFPLFSPDSYAGVRLESDRSIKKLLTASGELDDATVERVHQILARVLPPR